MIWKSDDEGRLCRKARLYADSGYQGIQQNAHPDTEIPYKKTKKHKLTKDERAYNHALSRLRPRRARLR